VEDTRQLRKYFSALAEESVVDEQAGLKQFEAIWKQSNERKLHYIRNIHDVSLLAQLG